MDGVILGRHGESDLSVRGLTNGDPARACGLTETGRAQSRRLGELVASEPLDLCVTSAFARTRETAEIALAGRDVPRLVLPELNDIRFGDFEALTLAEYRAWAHTAGPTDVPPGGGESRAACVARYVRGFRRLLARPERLALVVAHGLPIRYVLNPRLRCDSTLAPRRRSALGGSSETPPCAAGARCSLRCGVLGRPRITRDTRAPCVLASEQAAHSGSEGRSAGPS